MEEKTTKGSRRLPRIRFLLLISKFEQLNLFCLGGAIVAQSWTFFRCQCVDLIGNHCQNDDDHMITNSTWLHDDYMMIWWWSYDHCIHMIVTLLGWKLYPGWGFNSREGSSERSSLFRYTKSEWCWIPFDVCWMMNRFPIHEYVCWMMNRFPIQQYSNIFLYICVFYFVCTLSLWTRGKIRVFSWSLCLKQASLDFCTSFWFQISVLVSDFCTGFRFLVSDFCTGFRFLYWFQIFVLVSGFRFLFVDLETEQKNKLGCVRWANKWTRSHLLLFIYLHI